MRVPSYRSQITPEQILAAYQQGCFPMARGQHGEIDWFIAEPRTVVPLDDRFRVRRSLRQIRRKTEYQIRFNTQFVQVIQACSRQGLLDEDDIWISDEIIYLYTELHQRGFAHSVEVWMDGELSGGLYGVAMQGAFFGESMFSRKPSASQIALVALVEHLRMRGYRLLDSQMRTQHIAHFGAIDMTHLDYLNLLADALTYDCVFI